MSDIPEAREILIELRARIERNECSAVAAIVEISNAIELMIREPSFRKTPPKSKAITLQKLAEIKRLIWQYPGASLQELGNMAGVNTGRISEILHGYYDEDGKFRHKIISY